MINPAVDGLAEHVGTAAAGALLGRSRASHYRAKNPPPPRPRTPRPAPANKLSAAERAHVLAVLTSQRFADNGGSRDKTLKMYEGHFHDLLNDVGKETVMADIIDWITARIPKA